MRLCALFFAAAFMLFGIDPGKDYRNFGSAKRLKGKTYVLTLFISEKESPWQDKEVKQTLENTFSAFKWIRLQAEKYGSSVSFDFYALGNKDKKIFADSIPKGPFEGYLSNSFISNAMRSAGYAAGFDFVKYAEETSDCKNSLVLVFCNSKGRSFAMPQSSEDCKLSREYGYAARPLEGSVIYKGALPAVIAHEVLHLFGAVDLYGKGGAEIFGSSIMKTTEGGLDNLGLDSLTSFLTGLTNIYDGSFDVFLRR